MSCLFLVGLNHKTAPVEVRERLALPPERLAHALDYVLEVPGIAEAVVVSTCNRVEIYAWGAPEAAPSLHRSLASFHGANHGHPDGQGIGSHLYNLHGEAAARHLFEVASGLDSLVVGEAEILGQIRGAFEAAHDGGAAGWALDELFRRAIACGKRARTETGISRGALSIGAAGVELARQVFGSLLGRTVLILGAGQVSSRVAACLISSGAREIRVANRNPDRARELAGTFAASRGSALAVAWEEVPALLATTDIVIASTGAPHYVLGLPQVEAAVKGRRHPLLVVDIAVPRDVDPQVGELDGVFLFDIDDLQGVVEQNRLGRTAEAHDVALIVEQEAASWQQWYEVHEARPVLAALAGHASKVREAETSAALARLKHLSPRDRQVVAAMGHAIAGKLIHPPLAHLRSGGVADADALRRAFGLEETGDPSREADSH